MGLLASCTLVTGAPVVRKLLLASESKNVNVDCAKECGGDKGILGGGQARR